MANRPAFDFCIIGAGLAGISTADVLSEKGASVCVIERDEIASGASGTPIGLVNPATGRFGTKSWKADECYPSILNDLEKAQSHTSNQFFKKSGVLRPALDEKIAHKMKLNLETTDWLQDWCQWLDKEEISELNKDINCVDGGLWLPIGLTVDIGAFLRVKADLLTKRNVPIFSNCRYKIEEQGHFKINFDNGESLTTNSIIFCAGFNTKSSDYWDFLPLNPVKGQVALFERNSPLAFNFSLSALGYIGSLSANTFMVGSTYEHHFEDLKPDNKGLNYIKTRLEKVYPPLFNEANLLDQWAGLRASTPDRMPIVGRHPIKENMFLFTGLGSKGLLYSSWLAKRLGDFIVDSIPLPNKVSISRFNI